MDHGLYCCDLFDKYEMALLCNTYTGNRLEQVSYLKEFAKSTTSRENHFSSSKVRSIIKRLNNVNDREYLRAMDLFYHSQHNRYIMTWVHPPRNDRLDDYWIDDNCDSSWIDEMEE